MTNKTSKKNKTEKSLFWILALIIVLGAVLRFGYLYQLYGDKRLFEPNEGSDGYTYDQWAKNIADGNIIGDSVFYYGPLYSYVVAVLYSVFGRHLMVVYAFQAMLGLILIYLVYRTGRSLFNETAGLIAGLLCSIYAVFIFYEGQILLDYFVAFMSVLFMYYIVKYQQNQSIANVILTGVIMGFGALARANILIMAPVVFLWILLSGYFEPAKPENSNNKFQSPNRNQIQVNAKNANSVNAEYKPVSQAERNSDGFKLSSLRVKHSLVFAAVLILVILPVTVRNYIVGKDFVLITSNMGVNFFIGNSKDSLGWFHYPENSKKLEAEVRERGIKKPSEVSSFYAKKTIGEIKNDFAGYLGLQWRKIRLLFWAGEISNNENYEVNRSRFSVLRLPLAHFGIILPLGIAGMLLSLKQWRKNIMFYCFFVLYAFSITAFFVTGRYRLPLVPVLMIFGGYVIWKLYDYIVSKKYIRAVFPVAVGVLLAYSANSEATMPDKTITYYDKALVYVTDGEVEGALTELEKVLAVHPQFSDAKVTFDNICGLLGDHYVKKNNLGDAERIYRTQMKYSPERQSVYVNLGIISNLKGDRTEAIRWYKKALEKNPEHYRLYRRIGDLYNLLGDMHSARPYYEKYSSFDFPDSDIEQVRQYLKSAGERGQAR